MARFHKHEFPNLHMVGKEEIRQVVHELQQAAVSGLSFELQKALNNTFVFRPQVYISVNLFGSPGISISHSAHSPFRALF